MINEDYREYAQTMCESVHRREMLAQLLGSRRCGVVLEEGKEVPCVNCWHRGQACLADHAKGRFSYMSEAQAMDRTRHNFDGKCGGVPRADCVECFKRRTPPLKNFMFLADCLECENCDGRAPQWVCVVDGAPCLNCYGARDLEAPFYGCSNCLGDWIETNVRPTVTGICYPYFRRVLESLGAHMCDTCYGEEDVRFACRSLGTRKPCFHCYVFGLYNCQYHRDDQRCEITAICEGCIEEFHYSG